MNRYAAGLIAVIQLTLFAAVLSACGQIPVEPLPPAVTAVPVQAATAVSAPAATPLVASGRPSTPIHVELSLSKSPALGDEVEAQLAVGALEAAPNTTATLILPPGVTLVSGDVNWQGDLLPDQPVVLHATLRFTEAGDVQLTGRALHDVGNGDVWGDQATLYLHIAAPGEPADLDTPTPPPAVPVP